MKTNLNLMITFTLFIVFRSTCLSASCCGSNISAPAMITTGEKIKIQIGFSESENTFHALGKNQIILLEQPQNLRSMNLKLGYLFKNDFQFGFQVQQNHSGQFSDAIFSQGAEFVTIDNIRTFAWSQISLPTGQSIEQVGVNQKPTGSGFPVVSVGAMFSQLLPSGDLALTLQIGQGLTSKIQTFQNESIHIYPGHQVSTGLSGGVSRGPWRIGSSYQYQWHAGRQVEHQIRGLASYQSTIGLQLSYMSGSQIWNLVYSDDSLIGPAQNAYLNRGFSISLIDRWFE